MSAWMTNGRNYCPSLGEGHKGADICYRCSEMNGDSPCNQGREGVPAVETARAKAPRHGGGRVFGGWPLSIRDAVGQGALGSPEGQAFPRLLITRIICQPASQTSPNSTWALQVDPVHSQAWRAGPWCDQRWALWGQTCPGGGWTQGGLRRRLEKNCRSDEERDRGAGVEIRMNPQLPRTLSIYDHLIGGGKYNATRLLELCGQGLMFKKIKTGPVPVNVNGLWRKSDKLGFTVKSEVTSGKGRSAPSSEGYTVGVFLAPLLPKPLYFYFFIFLSFLFFF